MEHPKIAIITSGYFPLPPIRGGAVEALVDILYRENAKIQSADITIYSVYDREAEKVSSQIKGNKIEYIKIPVIIKAMDWLSYFFFKDILRKKKHMSYRYIFQRLYYINKVSRFIANEDHDYIVFENHPTLLGALRKNGNKDKYKDKYYYHAHNEILNTFGYDKELAGVKSFICVSGFIGNKIRELTLDHPAKNIKVLKNRVDEQKFRGLDKEKEQLFREKYNIPKDCLLFTFTGRLSPEKGVKELISAYKQAHPPNSKLVIAGSYYFGSGLKSEYENELKRSAEDIKDEIIFTGNIVYDEMPYMYAVSDVIMLPSIWDDPAPLTVIESLTCGKPLITTCSGGIAEYADQKNSILLQNNDDLVNELAAAINTLAQDVNRRDELAEMARVESDSWKKADYYKEFIQLLSGES